MMRWLLLCLVIVVMRTAMCKPVANKRGPPQPNVVEGGSKAEEDVGTGLEYDRYLRQVVEVLESDDEFRKKLENANISDIKSGAIAMHLELVNNTIRTKLDEIKRMEVQRLQELARLRIRHMKGIKNMEIPGHLDLKNPHSFEMQDLESLIKKTTNDLEEVDKRRKEDFKTYEMEKEYEYREKLNHLPAEEQAKVKQHHEELQKKHKQHEKLNHPGSKDQFEEVWEKEDELKDQDFDPKTFFYKHDLNGDKLWDFQEVEAVLQRELDKVYDAKNPTEEDDPNERYEEMNRMREHVFKEIDQNKDLMISEEEFISYTGRHGENKKFQEDEGWESINDTPEFTDEEYEEYLRQFHPQPGVVPPPVDGTDNLQFSPEEQLRHQQQQQGLHQPGTGAQQAGHPQQGLNQQQHMQQFQQHPGQAGDGQAPPAGIHPDPNQQQQLHQQQLNQQQLNQQQLNQQQLNQQQLNQQQLNQQQHQQQQQQLNQQQQQQQQLNQQQLHQQQQQNNQQHLNQQQAGQPIQGQGQPAQGHGQPVQGQAQPGQGHPPAQPMHGQAPVV